MSPVSLEALQGLTGRLVTLGLLHVVWIGLLAAAVAAIVIQALPRLSHRFRYVMLAMAMVAVAAGPIVVVIIQRSGVEPRSLAGEISIRVATTRLPTESKRLVEPKKQPVGSTPTRSIAVSLRLERLMTATINRLEAIQPILLASWLIGVVVLSARLILAGFAIRRLIRSASIARHNPLQVRADELARRLRIRRAPAVLVHPGPIEPGLCGLFRPILLLPGPWLVVADAGRIDAILAHELAHARHLDLPANLLQRLVETALFFHPAVRWLSWALRRERELCADAVAVALTGDPIALASALESVARFRLSSSASGRRAPLFGASLGGQDLSLLPRIQELLGMTPNTPVHRSLWPWVSIPAAGLFALLGASIGLAQDPPKPAEPPVSSIGIRPSSVRASSTGKESGGTKPDHDNSKPSTDDQISLAVRYLTVEASAWRGPLQGEMRKVHHDHLVTAWIVQDSTARNLITRVQQNPRSNIRQAPKVTTFDGARATITFSAKDQIVDEIQKLGASSAPEFHPITKPVELASQVDLVGNIRPGSVMLTVDHFLTSLMPAPDEAARANHASSGKSAETKKQAGNGWAPSLWTKHTRVEQDVPAETSLLIRLGQEVERRERPLVIGDPPAKAELITRDNLILITPVTIRLEPEESPSVPVSRTSRHPEPGRTTRL